MPNKDIELALKMHQSKEYSISEIEKATGISKTSLYRYLEKIILDIFNKITYYKCNK